MMNAEPFRAHTTNPTTQHKDERVNMITAAVLAKPGQAIEVRTFARPSLEAGAVLLKTLGSEVCGTDTHLAKGQLAGVPYRLFQAT